MEAPLVRSHLTEIIRKIKEVFPEAKYDPHLKVNAGGVKSASGFSCWQAPTSIIGASLIPNEVLAAFNATFSSGAFSVYWTTEGPELVITTGDQKREEVSTEGARKCDKLARMILQEFPGSKRAIDLSNPLFFMGGASKSIICTAMHQTLKANQSMGTFSVQFVDGEFGLRVHIRTQPEASPKEDTLMEELHAMDSQVHLTPQYITEKAGLIAHIKKYWQGSVAQIPPFAMLSVDPETGKYMDIDQHDCSVILEALKQDPKFASIELGLRRSADDKTFIRANLPSE